MKHIGWFTLIALCLFAMKGIRRNSPDMYSRDLLGDVKVRGTRLEKNQFDNQEMRHISALKQALDSTSNRQQGELSNVAAEPREPAQEHQ